MNFKFYNVNNNKQYDIENQINVFSITKQKKKKGGKLNLLLQRVIVNSFAWKISNLIWKLI